MLPSKENAERALKIIMQVRAGDAPNNGQLLDVDARFLQDFLAAAHRKLPHESSFPIAKKLGAELTTPVANSKEHK